MSCSLKRKFTVLRRFTVYRRGAGGITQVYGPRKTRDDRIMTVKLSFISVCHCYWYCVALIMFVFKLTWILKGLSVKLLIELCKIWEFCRILMICMYWEPNLMSRWTYKYTYFWMLYMGFELTTTQSKAENYPSIFISIYWKY